jgi:hypothetical protein
MQQWSLRLEVQSVGCGALLLGCVRTKKCFNPQPAAGQLHVLLPRISHLPNPPGLLGLPFQLPASPL